MIEFLRYYRPGIVETLPRLLRPDRLWRPTQKAIQVADLRQSSVRSRVGRCARDQLTVSTSRILPRAAVGLAVVVLLALRVPSLAQPAAADQSLYAYAGQQLLAGHAPYEAAWDQKPPGIHAIYGVLWRLWPSDAVVGAADLAVSAGIAALLGHLGRQFGQPAVGWLAALVFLLLAHPSLHRLGGIFVRGQCETFIAFLITAALTLVCFRASHWWPRLAAGVCVGLAFWLKYNAAVYAVPVLIALATMRRSSDSRGQIRTDALAFIAGALAIGVAGVAYIWWRGALTDLRLATIDYNLQYSADTYRSLWDAMLYVLRLPFRHARYDLLWFLGGAGVLMSLAHREGRRTGVLALAWTTSAVLSIAINGARDLPQYFVQAWPALAWAAAAGLAAAWRSGGRMARVLAIAVVIVGLWRVGIDAPLAGGIRLGGLTGLMANVTFDLDYLRGRVDRATYLDRFGGQRDQDKFAARDVDEIAGFVRETTAPTDTILVFGFSPGIYVKSGRPSASRFFWSRPVVIEFSADHAGYGVNGLLGELSRNRPSLVILQKRDWGPAESNSEAFFLTNPSLSDWLARGYRLEREARLYSIWRRLG